MSCQDEDSQIWGNLGIEVPIRVRVGGLDIKPGHKIQELGLRANQIKEQGHQT